MSGNSGWFHGCQDERTMQIVCQRLRIAQICVGLCLCLSRFFLLALVRLCTSESQLGSVQIDVHPAMVRELAHQYLLTQFVQNPFLYNTLQRSRTELWIVAQLRQPINRRVAHCQINAILFQSAQPSSAFAIPRFGVFHLYPTART